MFGLVYLTLAFWLGLRLMIPLRPWLIPGDNGIGLLGGTWRMPPWLVSLPGAFLIGTLLLTWATYLVAYLFRETGTPLLPANSIIMGLVTLALGVEAFWRGRLTDIRTWPSRLDDAISRWPMHSLVTLFFMVAATVYVVFVFHDKGNTLFIAPTVSGDYGAHLAMIRSFSMGNNFPTQYPHFPAGSIRYHFFFDFLVGNLEFLGLPIGWAYDLPAWLSLMAFGMLFSALTIRVTASGAAALLSLILIFFRSSPAFFFNWHHWGPTPLAFLNNILHASKFIGLTTHEDWGLWLLFNVFGNQRHLPFGFAILFLVLLFALPGVQAFGLRTEWRRLPDRKFGLRRFQHWLKTGYASWDAWRPQAIYPAMLMGLIAGLSGFWNGATLISLLLILFCIAWSSTRRLELLIIGVVAALCFGLEIQTLMPATPDDVLGAFPKLQPGFLAYSWSPLVIGRYYLDLLGLLVPMTLIAVCLARPGTRWLLLSISIPLLFGTFVQTTDDVAINHKFIQTTLLFYDVATAWLLIRLSRWKKPVGFITCLLLLIPLTCTGWIDFFGFKNNNLNPITLQSVSETTRFIQDNTDSHDLFLTDTVLINGALLAGRSLYLGWPDFAKSAGYDVSDRVKVVQTVFESRDPATLRYLLREANVHYLLIDDAVRKNPAYRFNDRTIRNTFPQVYSDARENIQIYETF